LYSDPTETSIALDDLLGGTHLICNHQNSPYYKEIVSENKSCRLFVDEKEYFKLLDRQDRINEIRRKIEEKKLLRGRGHK
jgi:hypothetical protein